MTASAPPVNSAPPQVYSRIICASSNCRPSCVTMKKLPLKPAARVSIMSASSSASPSLNSSIVNGAWSSAASAPPASRQRSRWSFERQGAGRPQHSRLASAGRCGRSWRAAPSRLSMASCVGASSIWRNGSLKSFGFRSRSKRSVASCVPWASASSRQGRAIMRKTWKPPRILKKLL
jgi:hypothetical protein